MIIFNDFRWITLLRRNICKTMENPLNTVRQTLLIGNPEVVNEYKDNAQSKQLHRERIQNVNTLFVY